MASRSFTFFEQQNFVCVKEEIMFLHGTCLRKNGYTLLEMVMVLVLAGLLVSISVPMYMRHTLHAKIARTKADLERLRAAIAAFYAQEGQYPSGMTFSDDLTLAVPPFIDEIPGDGFTDINTVYYHNPIFCPDSPQGGTPGGWCYGGDGYDGAILPNLPDDDASYGSQKFSEY